MFSGGLSDFTFQYPVKYILAYDHPINTVVQPSTIDPPWAVLSPIRAAGFPPNITLEDPETMLSGGPTQVHMSPTVAAGCPAISTVAAPGGRMGPPTCGMGGVPGVSNGQTCMSPTLAAGWPISNIV